MDIVPSCFYPTTVCVVDDDEHYLDALEVSLSTKDYGNLFCFFSDANEALEYLNKKHKEANLARKWVETLDADLPDNHLIKINFKDVAKELTDNKRFGEVSVVVVDYDMPSMDGIQFCKSIHSPYVQKIMATGAADETLAVSAFNGKVIDAFIGKHEADFWANVESKIRKLQNLYFAKLTYPLHLSLKLKTKASLLLEDPAFIKFFEDLLVEHDIQEYYQLESSGSFILFDNKGEHHVLFVYNKDKINADKLEIASDLEDEVSPALKTAILTEQKMLCYYDMLRYDLPPLSEWHKYALAFKTLEGKFGCYYYAFASNYLKLDPLHLKTFQSFRLQARS